MPVNPFRDDSVREPRDNRPSDFCEVLGLNSNSTMAAVRLAAPDTNDDPFPAYLPSSQPTPSDGDRVIVGYTDSGEAYIEVNLDSQLSFSGATVYDQSSKPSDASKGDFWIDSDDYLAELVWEYFDERAGTSDWRMHADSDYAYLQNSPSDNVSVVKKGATDTLDSNVEHFVNHGDSVHSVVSDSNNFYVGGDNGVDKYAKSDGSQSWNSLDAANVLLYESSHIYALDDGTHEIDKLNTDGTTDWTYSASNNLFAHHMRSDGTNIYTIDDTDLEAIAISGGSTEWTTALGTDVIGNIGTDGTYVFVAAFDNANTEWQLEAYNVSDGTQAFTSNAQSGKALSLVHDGGFVYVKSAPNFDQGMRDNKVTKFDVSNSGSVSESTTFEARTSTSDGQLNSDADNVYPKSGERVFALSKSDLSEQWRTEQLENTRGNLIGRMQSVAVTSDTLYIESGGLFRKYNKGQFAREGNVYIYDGDDWVRTANRILRE